MVVKQLIEQLKTLPQDMDVWIDITPDECELWKLIPLKTAEVVDVELDDEIVLLSARIEVADDFGNEVLN